MNQDLVSDAEKIRIAAIDDVKARQESSEEYKLYRRIQEDKSAAKNFEVFNTQCLINEMLNKFIMFIRNYKNGINESYRIDNKSPFYELVEEQDFVDYALANIVPSVDNEVFDKNDVERVNEKKEEREKIAKKFYEYNIDELRDFLFLCHSIKPLPIPKKQKDGSIDVLECYAAGINSESYFGNINNWFMERKDYFLSDIKTIIVDGEINGRKIATKTEIESTKPKKY